MCNKHFTVRRWSGTNVITKVYLITNILRIMSNKSWVSETFLGPTLLFFLFLFLSPLLYGCKYLEFTTSHLERHAISFSILFLVFFYFVKIWPHCYRLDVNFRNCSLPSWVCNRLYRIPCHIHVNDCDPFYIIFIIALIYRWSIFILKLISIWNYIV